MSVLTLAPVSDIKSTQTTEVEATITLPKKEPIKLKPVASTAKPELSTGKAEQSTSIIEPQILERTHVTMRSKPEPDKLDQMMSEIESKSKPNLQLLKRLKTELISALSMQMNTIHSTITQEDVI